MVTLTRRGQGSFIGRNDRGGEVRIGRTGEPEAFSPGELLVLAVAGCAGLSAEPVISRRLGDDFAMRIEASGERDPEANRYRLVHERIELDLSRLDEPVRTRLKLAIDRAIEAACTVQRSIEPGLPVRREITRAD